jgi:putative tryptophan/tyrosine transport system substrate-binding protein
MAARKPSPDAERAGRSLGLHVTPVPIRRPDEVDRLFATIDHARADAPLISEDPTVVSAAINQITQRAMARRLPDDRGSGRFAKAGTLLTYGPDFAAMFRRTAVYVDKILKGAKPAELPVEEPTKFELVINLKTAKALGLTIPPYTPPVRPES